VAAGLIRPVQRHPFTGLITAVGFLTAFAVEQLGG
jgi:hypothetical protein